MDTKLFPLLSVKAMGEGRATVVFATMGVRDRDGDVTKPGFFGEQHAMLVGAHDWQSPTIGKARVYEKGNEALADLIFNLDMAAGKEWFASVKFDHDNPPAKQQYSYGFTIKAGGSSEGEIDGQQARLLQPCADGSPGCDIHEVSPVLLGAGIDTRTVAAKQLQSFREEIAAALASVKAISERAGRFAKMRASEGRKVTAERLAQLSELATELRTLAALDAEIAAVAKVGPTPEGLRALIEHERTRARLAGVAA